MWLAVQGNIDVLGKEEGRLGNRQMKGQFPKPPKSDEFGKILPFKVILEKMKVKEAGVK